MNPQPGFKQFAAVPTVTPLNIGSDLPRGAAPDDRPDTDAVEDDCDDPRELDFYWTRWEEHDD